MTLLDRQLLALPSCSRWWTEVLRGHVIGHDATWAPGQVLSTVSEISTRVTKETQQNHDGSVWISNQLIPVLVPAIDCGFLQSFWDRGK